MITVIITSILGIALAIYFYSVGAMGAALGAVIAVVIVVVLWVISWR